MPARGAAPAARAANAASAHAAWIDVIRPDAGHRLRVTPARGQEMRLFFDPSDADIMAIGGDLVFRFDDGGQAVLAGAADASQAGEDGPLLAPDGRALSVAELLGREGDVDTLAEALAGAGAPAAR